MASALPSLGRIEVTSSIKDKLIPTQSTLMKMETKIIHYPLTGITLSKQSYFILRERTDWKGVQVIPAMAIHSVEMSIDSETAAANWTWKIKVQFGKGLNTELPERFQWRVMKMVRRLEHLFYEERLTDLGQFILEMAEGDLIHRSINTWREGVNRMEPSSFQLCAVPRQEAMDTNWNTESSLQKTPIHS